MEILKFFKIGDAPIYPNRGTEVSAGIDFYVPKPTDTEDELFDIMLAKICKDKDDDYCKMVEKRIDGLNPEDKFWTLVRYYDNTIFGIKFDGSFCEDGNCNLKPNENVVIPTGITANIPHNYCINMFNKSGIATKKSLIVGAQLIDEDYTGIIHIDLHNVGTKEIKICCGDKIAQGVVLKTNLDEVKIQGCDGANDKGKTSRGDGGFGSTGTKA